MVKKERSNNYVDNKVFYALLLEYSLTKSKKTHNDIAKIFLKIANNFLNRPRYINLTIDRKNEMVSDATWYMLKAVPKYNLEEKNPHAYFTKVAENAFLQYINSYVKRDKTFTSLEYLYGEDSIKSSDKYAESEN